MAAPCPVPRSSISLVNLSEKSSVIIPLTELFGMFVNKSSTKIVYISKNAFTFKASVSKLEIIFPNDVSIAKLPFLSGENPFATLKL